MLRDQCRLVYSRFTINLTFTTRFLLNCTTLTSHVSCVTSLITLNDSAISSLLISCRILFYRYQTYLLGIWQWYCVRQCNLPSMYDDIISVLITLLLCVWTLRQLSSYQSLGLKDFVGFLIAYFLHSLIIHGFSFLSFLSISLDFLDNYLK